MDKLVKSYASKLIAAVNAIPEKDVYFLASSLRDAWIQKKCIYFCGNGGSAANAIHLANDFIYGAGLKNGKGLRVEALSANSAILTCLANDVGYESIYSEQLKVKGESEDVLIVLSGSGNSPNVINALEVGNALKMKTFAILGYSGGRCRGIAQHVIHIDVDDMQIAEDMQLIVGHMCMQYLNQLKLVGSEFQ